VSIAYQDQETNNHYNYYRDYDPAVGRYIQTDPLGVLGKVAEQRIPLPGQDFESAFGLHTANIPRNQFPGIGRTQGTSRARDLYSYVEGNPLRWSDPKGLELFPPSGRGQGGGGGSCKLILDLVIGPAFDAAHNWLFFCVWRCSTSSCPPKTWFRSAVVTVPLHQGCDPTPP